MELQAEWTPDCQGKQDFDANLVHLSTRYWAQGGGYAERMADGQWLQNDDRPHIRPCAMATIYLQDEPLIYASFGGLTEEEVKAKVETWAREQFAKVVDAMRRTFRPSVTRQTLRAFDFPGGMTVKDLKELVRDWPETDEYGEPCEVWLCDGHGLSNQAIMASSLNMRQSDDGAKIWADFMLGHGA